MTSATEPRSKAISAVQLNAEVPTITKTRLDVYLAAALAAGGFVAWAPYALRTTFALDDYAFVSLREFQLTEHLQSYRPGQAFTTNAMTAVFGTHPHLYYLATELLAGMMLAVLFLTLRRLGVMRTPAAIGCLLLFVEPRADSLHLWWTASSITIAIILALGSVAAGVTWVANRPRSLSWLVCSELLLITSVVTYESVAVLILLGPATIFLSPSWRRSLIKFSIDLALAGVGEIYMFLNANPAQLAQATPRSQYFEHFRQLMADGYHVFLSGLPGALGASGVVGAVVGASTGGGLAVVLIHRRLNARGKRADGGWHVPAKAGLCVCCLLGAGFISWSPFVAANAYYSPATLGIGNRTNAASVIFFTVAFGMVGGTLIRSLLTARTLIAGTALTIVGTASVGGLTGGNANRTVADARDFVEAAQLRQQMLATIQRVVPAPPHGAVLLFGAYARYRGPEFVPIIAESWDSNGAVRLLYHDASLTGQPVESADRCTAVGILLPTAATPVPYRVARVIDVKNSAAVSITDLPSCQAQLPGLVAVSIDPRL